MKNKAVLSLIEEIAMVLVFAIAAAICLRVFVHANTLSRNLELTDSAYILARNTAEVIKNTSGKVLDGGTIEQSEENGLQLKVIEKDSGSSHLASAVISVYNDEKLLCEIPVNWQK